MTPIGLQLGTSQVDVVAGLTGIGPSYQLVAAPVSVTVLRNGYAGPLTLSAKLVGSTAAIGLQTFLSDSVGVVSITAASGVAPGTYNAEIAVETDGRGRKAATVSIAVMPFAARILRRALTVAVGATNTVSLEVKPPTVNPTITASATSGVSVSVSNETGGPYLDFTGTTPGNYTVTVTAAADGHQRSWPVQVVVQPAAAKTPVTFRLCRNLNGLGGGIGAFYSTTMVAAANDGEAWTRLTADASGQYTFNASDRVSIAEVFTYGLGQYAPGTAVRVLQLTAAELARMQCGLSRGTKTFRVRASNATPYFLALGYFRASSSGTGGVAGAGSLDLIASGTVSGSAGAEYRSIVRRGVDLASQDSVIVDFATTEALVLDSAALDVAGATVAPTTHVHTATTIARLGGVSAAGTSKYWGLRESQLVASDVQSISTGTATRGATRFFRAVVPLTLALGPELATPSVDTLNLIIRLARQAAYPDIAGVGQLMTKDGRGVYNYTEIWQTAAYAGSAGAEWVFSYPDLGRLLRVEQLTQGGTVGGIAGKGPTHLFWGAPGAAGDEIIWAKRTPTQFGIFLPFPAGY